MTKKKTRNTGSAAFPIIGGTAEYHLGMTLRDYFAAKAMQSLVLRENMYDVDSRDGLEVIAVNAFEIADAMIAERNKP